VTAIRIAATTQSRRRRNQRPSYALVMAFSGLILQHVEQDGRAPVSAVSLVEIAHATAGAEP